MFGFIGLLAANAHLYANSAKSWFVNYLLSDVEVEQIHVIDGRIVHFKAGLATITLSPSGIGDVVRWSGTQAAVGAGDLGMNQSTGRPSAFIGGSARNIRGEHEQIIPEGTVAFTANQAMGSNKLTGLANGSAATDSSSYGQSILRDGSNAFSADQDMGTFKLTGLGAPTLPGDAVTKAYADSLASGLSWQDAVLGNNLIATIATTKYVGNAAASVIEVLTVLGDAYMVDTADGSGDMAAAIVGDIWEYDGADWIKIVSGTGSGGPPSGTAVLSNTTTALISPLTDAQDEGGLTDWNGGASVTPNNLALELPIGVNVIVNSPDGVSLVNGDSYQNHTVATSWTLSQGDASFFVPDGVSFAVRDTGSLYGVDLATSTHKGMIARFDGTTNDPTADIYTTQDGDAILVKGINQVDENKAFVYQGSVPTGTYVQFAGAGGSHGDLGNLTVDDHTQYVLLAGSIGRNTMSGSLRLDGSQLDFVNSGVLLLPASTTPAQTADASIVWDSDDNELTVGDSVGRKTMVDKTSTQTMTNKTLTSPVITAMSVSGTHLMTDDGIFRPSTDNNGSLGTASFRYKLIRGVTVTSGDHNFVHNERGVAWTLTEFDDGLYLVNRQTGKWFTMDMTPCAARCDDSELAPIAEDLAAIALAAK